MLQLLLRTLQKSCAVPDRAFYRLLCFTHPTHTHAPSIRHMEWKTQGGVFLSLTGERSNLTETQATRLAPSCPSNGRSSVNFQLLLKQGFLEAQRNKQSLFYTLILQVISLDFKCLKQIKREKKPHIVLLKNILGIFAQYWEKAIV